MRSRFNPWVRKIPWRREWQPTPVFLPRESHGQASLAGYSPWGCKESDITEQLIHTYLLNVSRSKEIIKIRAKIHETETKKQKKKKAMEKINETKSEFFEEINKVAKPLGRLIREGPNK